MNDIKGPVGPLTAEIIERADEASYRVVKAFQITERQGLSIEEWLALTAPIYEHACRELREQQESQKNNSTKSD